MQNRNHKLRTSLASGLAKGWSGFVWMLKILLPISFFTFLLAWSGLMNRLDFILEPVMDLIGLPPVAAIPLIAGLLTGPYGAIAAMAPVLKVHGLGKETGFLWLTAVTFGLTYGAAVIVEEAKEGHLSKDQLERLHISIGINHSVIEDPLLFLSLGLGLFWMIVPRLAAAIIAVQVFIIFKRLISLPRFSKVSIGDH
jgi:hypothetical protein